MVVLNNGYSVIEDLAVIYSVSDMFFDECCCSNSCVGD